MQKKTNIALISLLLSIPSPANSNPNTNYSNVTNFESLPAIEEGEKTEHNKPLIFTTKKSKEFRTLITSNSEKQPNFSGHYIIIIWGCGTDCHEFAIINKKNGKVFTDKKINFVSGVMGNDEARIDFRKNSRLIIINGRINDKKEGKFFYDWDGEKLKLIKVQKLEKIDIYDK